MHARYARRRQANAFGGATFIFILMAVNSIGYSVGVSGVASVIELMTTREALLFMAGSYAAFYTGSMVMFEVRRIEKEFDGGDAGAGGKKK